MNDILIGVAVFSSVILLLVIVLNVVGNVLLPQGEVTIIINDDPDKSINVDTGGTVLAALGDQNVYLPSACGGQGTCAQCKCQVIEGGGDILPTETAYINRQDQKNNWRLGCQVKIRNDMKIQVPDEIFSIRKWDAVVKSNENVATFIKELVLELPEDDPIVFESGGYIQIDVQNIKIKTIKTLKFKICTLAIGTNLIFGNILLRILNQFLEHIQWQITPQKVI